MRQKQVDLTLLFKSPLCHDLHKSNTSFLGKLDKMQGIKNLAGVITGKVKNPHQKNYFILSFSELLNHFHVIIG
jgi:hypothetical protein